MHYAVVRRRAKLTAQHRVIYAIPCNTMTNNQMQYNAMQYDAMQYHAKQSKTIQYLQYKEIPCNTLGTLSEKNYGIIWEFFPNNTVIFSESVPQNYLKISPLSLLPLCPPPLKKALMALMARKTPRK